LIHAGLKRPKTHKLHLNDPFTCGNFSERGFRCRNSRNLVEHDDEETGQQNDEAATNESVSTSHFVVQQEFGLKSVSTLLLKIVYEKWIRIEEIGEKVVRI
jgi:hypothetical protein